MITSNKALEIVLNNIIDLGVEEIDLEAAISRVLGEKIYADRDFPPFDRVCMDGIAINYKSFEQGQRFFKVEKVGAAGSVQQVLEDNSNCIEIMTGAPLPLNTTTIIRFEDLEEKEGGYEILVEVLDKKNIHLKGKDHKENTLLLDLNHPIKAIDVNVLATVGQSKVKVKKMPRIAVVSSGEELVPVGKVPANHQIRRSNVHMLIAKLKQLGVEADAFHVQDDVQVIHEELTTIFETHDVLLLSGGVSKGKFDYIPHVLEMLNVQKLFHRVKQRPGKPFWFGRKADKIVFAFPGNPVSSLACFHKYFIPWLHKTIGQGELKHQQVRLAEEIVFKPDLTYFAQAKIQYEDDGTTTATISHGNGSGDMVNPTQMDGFVELNSQQSVFKVGTVVPFIPF